MNPSQVDVELAEYIQELNIESLRSQLFGTRRDSWTYSMIAIQHGSLRPKGLAEADLSEMAFLLCTSPQSFIGT
jgi:hypothetical protein